ncbi:MAG: tol-pal system protein YbgF [Deltaproteobacteria bacterium]|nr:tol-pal system protein YbgF [Deltaproteobacteria bacterium]MBI2341138.1 tol-pal system protein YbgF [Deltaproteobacteria bacterium]
MKRFHVLLFIACFTIISGAAQADPVNDRLTALETSIKAFQGDSVSRNEKVASALAVIEQIKQDYQLIQGTLEANDHQIKEQQAEINRLKRDVTDRISSIEERLEIYDQQVTKAVAKVLPQAANETENYQKALDFVHKSDFLTAVAAFRSFLKSYSKSELADNAQYWIGECYYALKDYAKAIKEFQIISEKYIKSDKVAGAVLKQGFSFAELGMIEEAKTFLNKVIKDYPGSDESVRAKEKIDRLLVPDVTNTIPLAPGVNSAPPKAPAPAAETETKVKD